MKIRRNFEKESLPLTADARRKRALSFTGAAYGRVTGWGKLGGTHLKL